ncbi:MAG: TonB family protein [Candidatus Marinimicrobia bacterium]|nr:TonB family protein [Candidatus Neomarinimicrobiota bacterium]
MQRFHNTNTFRMPRISLLVILIMATAFFSCSSPRFIKTPIELPPLPMEKNGPVKFVAYDEPPVPIGGYAAIQKNIVYPKSAKKNRIQGTVVVQFFVNEKGRVTGVNIVKGMPDTGLDEAAIQAIWNTRFKPAKQKGQPVGVWITLPINFRLR